MKKVMVVFATGAQLPPIDVPNDAEIDFDGHTLTIGAEGSGYEFETVFVALGQGGAVLIQDANTKRIHPVQDLPPRDPFGNNPG